MILVFEWKLQQFIQKEKSLLLALSLIISEKTCNRIKTTALNSWRDILKSKRTITHVYYMTEPCVVPQRYIHANHVCNIFHVFIAVIESLIQRGGSINGVKMPCAKKKEKKNFYILLWKYFQWTIVQFEHWFSLCCVYFVWILCDFIEKSTLLEAKLFLSLFIKFFPPPHLSVEKGWENLLFHCFASKKFPTVTHHLKSVHNWCYSWLNEKLLLE